MPKIILKINSAADRIVDSEKICCYLAEASLPEEVFTKCRETGKMVLLCGQAAAVQCQKFDLDGIVIEPDPAQPLKAQIKKDQALLKHGKVLGVIIPPRRHEAMLASETEPDFVAFRLGMAEVQTAAEVIAWYNDLFLIQSALDLSKGPQDISGIETDFVIINSRDGEDFGC